MLQDPWFQTISKQAEEIGYDEGKAQGMIEGMAQSLAESVSQGLGDIMQQVEMTTSKRIALNLLWDGQLSEEKVAQYTGLPLQEVQRLKNL